MNIICNGLLTPNTVGNIDNVLAYALGLQRLGHEVYVFEDVEANGCFDANWRPARFDAWDGRRHFESFARAYGLWPRCCLIYNQGEATHGLSFAEAMAVAKETDLLVIVGGRLKTPQIVEAVKCRAYVDINPAKTQVYVAQHGVDYGFNQYQHFFTYGLSIGTPACEIPTGNLAWHGVLPPVHLPRWPAGIDARCERFTTVSTWAGRSTFNFNGKYSGEKSDQWQHFITLPRRTTQPLEVALRIEPGYAQDRRLFVDHGWILTDPRQLRTFEDYRGYLARSRAEFSTAHNRYVQFRTGWVSDRSARYLASGKPVLVQSTGQEAHLPTGKGLLTFTTLDEAVAGIEAINGDYLAHCRAARALAEEYFDSDRVLTTMLRQMGFDRAAVGRPAAMAG